MFPHSPLLDWSSNKQRTVMLRLLKNNRRGSTTRNRPLKFATGMKVLKKDFTRKKWKGEGIDYRCLGPYMITKDLCKGFFSLKSLDNGKEIKTIHGAHLKLYITPPTPPADNDSPIENSFELFVDSISRDSSCPPAKRKRVRRK